MRLGGTGNNLELSDERARRSVPIRSLNTTQDPPTRTGFVHPVIDGRALRERPQRLTATLTVIRAWLKAGRPRCVGRPLATFEAWSDVIGGILQGIGEAGGFLTNLEEVRKMDDKTAAEREIRSPRPTAYRRGI